MSLNILQRSLDKWIIQQWQGPNNELLCKIIEAVGMDGSESVLIKTVTRGQSWLSLRAFPQQSAHAQVKDPAGPAPTTTTRLHFSTCPDSTITVNQITGAGNGFPKRQG